jgi:hypothetical protein
VAVVVLDPSGELRTAYLCFGAHLPRLRHLCTPRVPKR